MKVMVTQMYNCMRTEFSKCFHSKNFIISITICVLLALSSASYFCQGYLNIHDVLNQYCFENGHMISNELFPVWTSFNYWIGGESETLAYSAFYTLLPIFAILPYSLSCLQEKTSSYANQILVRIGRRPYYLSKGIVCFSAAFITIVVPLILNFAITVAFIPSTVPQINYEIYNHVYFGAMWADLFYSYPLIYVILYILLDGLFAGVIALFGYALSFYITNQFAAAALPLLLFWGVDYLSGLLARAIPGTKWSYEISPIAYLHPATIRYDPNAFLIGVEAAILFLSATAIIYKMGVQHE